MRKQLRINEQYSIGPDDPCFIIAEIGNNHQGDEEIASRMIRAAAEAGADAVKFQKRDTNALLTRTGRQVPYTGPNSFGPTYGEHRNALELDFDALRRLKRQAETLGLVFFASAWDLPSLDGLIELGVPVMKVASADLVNIPLLRRCGKHAIPVILSTGMSELAEIDTAVSELRRFNTPLALLHCNSSYPCPPKDTALAGMEELALRYNLPVGYSGHETGLGPSVAAVALGACIVERHFTLDKTQPGTDHAASLEPSEFARLVSMIRDAQASISAPGRRVTATERTCATKLRKSIVAKRDIQAGTRISEADITVKSPGTGISPLRWDAVQGCIALRDFKMDEQLETASLTTESASMETAR